MYFTSICDSIFHKFHHQSSSQFTPQVLSSSQGNILEDEAAVQVGRIVEWSLRKVPRFFSQFDHGIYWKYHGNIVGYDGIYIYNLCMRYRGWLPNSTPVEGCGKKPMGFNHPKVVQDFARIHSYPPFISESKQWLSGFSTGTTVASICDSHCIWQVFFGTPLTVLHWQAFRIHFRVHRSTTGNPRGTPKMVKQKMMVKMVKHISIVS